MPAVVTTPVTAAITGFYTTTSTNQPTLTSTGVRTITTPVVAPVNVSGITHAVVRLPIRRWNGTTWVIEYTPRF